ncbi:prepilin-type N-terminal cleavage/methylation domain-containing protein [Parelusimicrobium proximum]|uniref:type IV pilin protein n=1 Tax=Parelusimicrobium proximum TaxID=3228953 RepID=UPI003D17809B
MKQNTSFKITRLFSYEENNGFTLIELLVVVLIIAILAAVALPQYTAAVEKSRGAEGFVNIKAMSQAVAAYRLQFDDMPTSLDDLTVTLPGTKTTHNGFDARKTNNFTFYLHSNGNPHAVRTRENAILWILVHNEGTSEYLCHSPENAYAYVCESLGGTLTGTNCGTSDTNRKCYSLK